MKLENIFVQEVSTCSHLELRTDWDNDWHTSVRIPDLKTATPEAVIHMLHQQIQLIENKLKADKPKTKMVRILSGTLDIWIGHRGVCYI